MGCPDAFRGERVTVTSRMNSNKRYIRIIVAFACHQLVLHQLPKCADDHLHLPAISLHAVHARRDEFPRLHHGMNFLDCMALLTLSFYMVSARCVATRRGATKDDIYIHVFLDVFLKSCLLSLFLLCETVLVGRSSGRSSLPSSTRIAARPLSHHSDLCNTLMVT
jgi:hypothetical protein